MIAWITTVWTTDAQDARVPDLKGIKWIGFAVASGTANKDTTCLVMVRAEQAEIDKLLADHNITTLGTEDTVKSTDGSDHRVIAKSLQDALHAETTRIQVDKVNPLAYWVGEDGGDVERAVVR